MDVAHTDSGGTMRENVGIPGLLGILILLTWLVGFIVFGFHAGLYHALVPVGIVLCLVQVTRRLNAG
jgi:hypothetical protein